MVAMKHNVRDPIAITKCMEAIVTQDFTVAKLVILIRRHICANTSVLQI